MVANWHDRYKIQAEWTKDLRSYIFSSLNLSTSSNMLEIGSGTGAITSQLHKMCKSRIFGLDINYPVTIFASRHDPETTFLQADAGFSPFKGESFDVILCHYFILWVVKKQEVLSEAYRLLKPNGFFIALAEPDYSGRIDSPPPLVELGNSQTIALQEQGADISCGQKLPLILSEAGFSNIKYGVLGHESQVGTLPDWRESEWKMIRTDLGKRYTPQELDHFQEVDKNSWLNGSRVLWVPTFYAVGEKPA